MSEEQRHFFEQRYRDMDTEELVELHSKGTLTDTAIEVLERVLNERGLTTEQREVLASVLKAESGDKQFAHLASLSDRFFGQVLDNIVALAIAIGVALLLAKLMSLPDGLVAAAALLSWFAYNLFSDGLYRGQSFGKKLMKTAVRHAESKMPCSFGRSLMRNLPLLAVGPLDWLSIFGDSRRRLGDRLAGTEVVNVSALGSSLDVPGSR